MTEQLDKGKILPLVIRLSVPAVIAQLITFLYNIVDRMYVAKIEGSGMDALAALGIAKIIPYPRDICSEFCQLFR